MVLLFFDIVSFVLILCAILFLIIFRKRVWERNIFYLIGLFLICVLFRDFSNIVNKAYFAGMEHFLEDFAAMLDPTLWIFVIYALLQYASKNELREEIVFRKQTEMALKKSREKLILAMRGAALTLWEWNVQTGKIVFSNPEEVEKFSTNGKEYGRGFTWEDTVHPDDVQLIKAKWRSYLDGESLSFEVVHRHRLSNNKWSWVLCCGKAIDFDERGDVLRAIGTHLDISDRKKLEEQLLQSQKMESVGRLAGGIAHDFNNLLMAILGYCDLVMDAFDANNPVTSDIVEIKKAGERAALLTQQLLAFGRKQILAPQVLDLNKLILDMDEMLRRLLGEDLEFVTVVDESLGLVNADTGQLEQVIINLAVNSRDAMPTGGKLIVETKNCELDKEYAEKYLEVAPGNYVMFSVSDTGEGMDKKVLEKVFEPFFSTKEKDKGTGLGLSTVHGIIKQSGGHVTVYSEPGRGTTVNVYLPRVDGKDGSQHGPLDLGEVVGGDETILVVEDEEIVRNLISKTLKKQGYRPLFASYCEEALELVQQHKDEIDLLVTDVVLPVMSGRELAEKIKEILPDIDVLYISGYTDNAIVHHGILEKDVHFLQKPFPPRRFLKKIRDMLDVNKNTE